MSSDAEKSGSEFDKKHRTKDEDDDVIFVKLVSAKKRDRADDESIIPQKKSKNGSKRGEADNEEFADKVVVASSSSSSSSSSSFSLPSFLSDGLDFFLGCKESNTKAISTAFQHLVTEDGKFAQYHILIEESKILETLASQKNLSTIVKSVLYLVADTTTDLEEWEKPPLIVGDVMDLENEDVKKVRSTTPLLPTGRYYPCDLFLFT